MPASRWRTGSSHELKADSPIGYPGNWLAFVADWAFGPFLAVGFVLGLLALAALAWRGRPAGWGRAPLGAVWRSAAGRSASPWWRCCWRRRRSLGHFLASNHNPRFLLAAMPGLAVAMAIGFAGQAGGRGPLALGFGLVAAQAVALAAVGRWPAPPPLAGLSSMQSRPGLACDWRAVAGQMGGLARDGAGRGCWSSARPTASTRCR